MLSFGEKFKITRSAGWSRMKKLLVFCIFSLICSSCLTRTQNNSVIRTAAAETLGEKDSWQSEGVAPYKEMLHIWGESSQEVNALVSDCSWVFLRKSIYEPLIRESPRRRDVLEQQVNRYLNSCMTKFRRLYEPRFYYKYRDAYREATDRVTFGRLIETAKLNYAQERSHPLISVPPFSPGYDHW